MKTSWDEENGEEKRKVDDPRRLGSRRIEPDVEKEILEVGGFTRGQLYNRRGGLDDRGLASLLEPGDSVIKVEPGCVHVRTREGSIQTYWNLDRPQPFLRPLTDEERSRLEQEERED